MQTNAKYQMQAGPIPHVFWIELYGDKMLHECAVLKHDQTGSVYFLKVADLDPIDKARLSRILAHPRARTYELYDLMAQQTLQNGVNALTYFHQLTKMIAPNGRIYDPREGMVSGVMGQVAASQAPVQAPANPAAGSNQVVA